MSIEIEKAYRVNPELLGSLDRLPYSDIDQTYFSSLVPNLLYPEVADGEWRIRREQVPGKEPVFTSTVKFGDKASGKRTEVETQLEAGAFGTTDRDIELYQTGTVKKRRYYLPDGTIIDRFDPQLHGQLLIAEREFASTEEAAIWQPPAWIIDDGSPFPSNRSLAIPVESDDVHEEVPTERVLHTLIEQHKAHGQLVVTVSGMTCSGKSTLAEELAIELDANLIHADNFHIGTRALLDKHGEVNHDWPHTYDYEAATVAATELLNGREVKVPVYDFVSAEPTHTPMPIHPEKTKIIVIDGLYAWVAGKMAAIQGIPTYNVLVDRPLYVCLLRRLKRDTNTESAAEFQRQQSMDPQEVLRYMLHTAIPTYLQHRAPRSLFDAVC